jgi:hypothetical protein
VRFRFGLRRFRGFETGALDGARNVVIGFRPAEGLSVFFDGVDVDADRGFQFRGGALDAAADLLFSDFGEEALDQIDPGTRGRREVNTPTRPRAEPFSDRWSFVGGVIVHDQANVEIGRDIAFDLAQETQELAPSVARIATSDDLRQPSEWVKSTLWTVVEK